MKETHDLWAQNGFNIAVTKITPSGYQTTCKSGSVAVSLKMPNYFS
jgi:hypothetical protein